MVEISGIKLDKTDRKLLTELDKDCRIPTTVLAKKVLKSRQAVEYRINRLIEKGVITSFNAAINPHAMGCTIYKAYLKLRNIPDERKRLVAWLEESGLIYWMSECTGRWDLLFSVYTKSDYEFFKLKNRLITEFSPVILEEYGDVIVDAKQYPKMYFANEIMPPVIVGGPLVRNELDELDDAILSQIVNNARIPLIELAGIVVSTPATVRNRLKHLEELGVIIQYRIGVDLNKLGLDLYKTVLKLDRYGPDDERRLLEYCSRLPNIHYFSRNLWQIELELVVSSYQEYYTIIEELKKTFPGVIRTVDSMEMITDEWTPSFAHLTAKKK